VGLPSAEGDREMRVPAGARRNGGHNIEITNAIGCLQMTLSILYRRHHCQRSAVVDSALSLVDFYNETVLWVRSVVMLIEQHPRATINFPLFHDLARGRRLMLPYTVFALANCLI